MHGVGHCEARRRSGEKDKGFFQLFGTYVSLVAYDKSIVADKMLTANFLSSNPVVRLFVDPTASMIELYCDSRVSKRPARLA